MNDNQIPKANPDYTLEKFEGEILLYTEAGTQAVYLNDAAYAIPEYWTDIHSAC